MAIDKYDKLNASNSEKVDKYILKQFIDVIKKIANPTGWNPKNSKKEIDAILKAFNNNIYTGIVEGINTGWDIAVEKNNDIAKKVFGKNLSKISKRDRLRYLSNNHDARRAFVERRIDGLMLSDRVWNITNQYRTALEWSLELAIKEGTSATKTATDLKKYLNEPTKLYRRVKDAEGNLTLSKAAQSYKPGKGIYRSAYKNALRLSRNEINFSYEKSQQTKREQQDFIVGIKIITSPSHKITDDYGGISCDALQGVYPKNFNWSNKWHVNCKCISLNVLKTTEEVDKDVERILQGKEPNKSSVNTVKGLPKNYVEYINNNKKMWENWKQEPIFIAKNATLPVAKNVKTSIAPQNQLNFVEGINIADHELRPRYYDDSILFPAIDKYQKDEKEWRGTNEQRNIINMYTFGKYNAYNGYRAMRYYTKNPETFKSVSDPIVGHMDEVFKELSKSIRTNKLQEDIILHRYVNKYNMESLSSLEIGDIYSDKMFTATSLLPQTEFGSFYMKIISKKGSPVSVIPGNARELEYLIDANTKMIIREKTTDSMTLEIISK